MQPRVELHHISVLDRVAAGMKCFRAAFTHDYHLAFGDCEVDDTYPEVSKS